MKKTHINQLIIPSLFQIFYSKSVYLFVSDLITDFQAVGLDFMDKRSSQWFVKKNFNTNERVSQFFPE